MTRRVSFGLIPLGSVQGRVVRDANANGCADPGEEPLDGVVLVHDGGARSEQVRRGAYRFDSIRSGDHVVSLLRESLPDGAVVTGIAQVPLSLGRDLLSAESTSPSRSRNVRRIDECFRRVVEVRRLHHHHRRA